MLASQVSYNKVTYQVKRWFVKMEWRMQILQMFLWWWWCWWEKGGGVCDTDVSPTIQTCKIPFQNWKLSWFSGIPSSHVDRFFTNWSQLKFEKIMKHLLGRFVWQSHIFTISVINFWKHLFLRLHDPEKQKALGARSLLKACAILLYHQILEPDPDCQKSSFLLLG